MAGRPAGWPIFEMKSDDVKDFEVSISGCGSLQQAVWNANRKGHSFKTEVVAKGKDTRTVRVWRVG